MLRLLVELKENQIFLYALPPDDDISFRLTDTTTTLILSPFFRVGII